MKPAVVFVLAFVVAGAASTGAKVVMTKAPATQAADSAKPDSAKVELPRADSAKRTVNGAAIGPDTAIAASAPIVKAPADTVRPVGGDSAPKAKPLSAAPASVVHDTTAIESERRVAKVFSSMDAKQAAKVLEHMNDADVRIILGYVGVKQAAQIMAALPPERVATLSKLAMTSGSSGSRK